ncbi:MAG: DUF6625 family protein [Leptolyngbyaceae cyanobacterium]
MTQPSICLVLPFFDEKKKLSWFRPKKFPSYFKYFLGSFAKNSNITLKIFTNIPHQSYRTLCQGSSIEFHPMSLSKVFDLFRTTLAIKDYEFDRFRAYKICDFKPTFGHVFSDYLKEFDYWGYIDADSIVGNLSRFWTAENFQDGEIISGTDRMVGYMTLYQNTDKINLLYQQSVDHQKVFNSHKSGFGFDENGRRKIEAMSQVIERCDIHMRHLRCVHNDFGTLNDHRDWAYDWADGSLTDRHLGKEIAMLHLMRSKRDPNFVFDTFQPNRNFSVSKNGLFYGPEG